MGRVLAATAEHQLLEAGLQLRALDSCVARHPQHAAVCALQRMLRCDPARAARLQTTRGRYRECLDALRMSSTESEGWLFAQEFRGVRTEYRHDSAGRLWLRTDGVMSGVSTLECLAMWREVDLFQRWFPLCLGSKVLAQQGRVETLAWVELSAGALPVGRRDMVLHGYGVDALADGFMMILGKSASQSDFPKIPFPPVRGFGSARMHVHGLQVVMQPLADRTVRCCYTCNIDIKAPLPKPVVQFATQRIVGAIFHALQKEAAGIRAGAAASAHAARMQRDAHVYLEWMLPRLDAALDLSALRSIVRSSSSSGASSRTGASQGR